MHKVVLVVALMACGKSEKQDAPATGQTPKETPKAEPKSDEPSVDVKKERLCKRIDTDPIAKVLEIDKLSRTGNGTFVKGGGQPASLICSYYEGGKHDGGMSFGFGIEATTEFEKRDVLGRYTWKDFDGLGQPAKIGRGKDIVAIQTIANGVKLFVRVNHESVPVPDLEKHAVAATKLVMQQLPADAAAELK